MTSYFVHRSDVPPDVLTFTINLNNKGKRSKDTEVAELTIDLNTLTNGDEVSDTTMCDDLISIHHAD